MPKYSVIIPNYNHCIFLRDRIESVLNQTYEDFEVIILDDCSTDNSVEIINSYKGDLHISHIIINTENSGSTFKQWQKGFSLCKGEYIWIAESDDVADLSFLERINKYILDNPDIVLGFTYSNIISENNQIVHYQEPINSFGTQVYKGKDFIKKYMLRNNSIINASAVIFKKESIPSDKSYTNFKFCGDYLFYCSIIKNGKVLLLAEYLNYFRMHQNKVTPKSLQTGLKYRELSIIMNMICGIFNINPLKRIFLKALMVSDMYNDIYIDKKYIHDCEIAIKRNNRYYILIIGKLIAMIKNLKSYFK